MVFAGSLLKIFTWRDGTPCFTEVNGAKRDDGWIGDLCIADGSAYPYGPFLWGSGPAWAAVAKDGGLIARTDMVNDHTRRLSLLQNNTLVGTFDFNMTLPTGAELKQAVKIQNQSSVGPPVHWHTDFPPSRYHEHLAFDAGGKLLVWLIDGRKGLINGYVFKIGSKG